MPSGLPHAGHLRARQAVFRAERYGGRALDQAAAVLGRYFARMSYAVNKRSDTDVYNQFPDVLNAAANVAVHAGLGERWQILAARDIRHTRDPVLRKSSYFAVHSVEAGLIDMAR